LTCGKQASTGFRGTL